MRESQYTIGQLMAMIALLAIDMTGLMQPNIFLSQTLFCLTYALFGTAVLGAVFRRGDDRAWWLGFLVFGAGYLLFMADSNNWIFRPLIFSPLPLLITDAVLQWAGYHNIADKFLVADSNFILIGHFFCAQLAALLGGALAWRFRAAAPASIRNQAPAEEATSTAPRRRSRAGLALKCALAVGSLAGAVVIIAKTRNSDLFAGGLFLFTGAALGCAVVGALFGRGKRREICAGVALFGLGYLYTTLLKPSDGPSDFELPRPRYVTDRFLEALRPLVPLSWRSGNASARVWEALEQPVPMHFPEGETLENLLKYIKMATSTSAFPEGIAVYVDPTGLQEAERTLNDTVTIDLQGVPLETTLRLALGQIQLRHVVRNGFLMITSEDNLNFITYDSFLIVGHCALALLAAAVGGTIAPWIAALSRRGMASSP